MKTVDFVTDFLKGPLGQYESQFDVFRNRNSFSDRTKKEEIQPRKKSINMPRRLKMLLPKY